MTKSFRAFHALQMAYSAVFSAADKSLKRQEGILTAHQVILFILCAENGLPSSTVAARAGISKSRLTGLVDALDRKGLIRRQQGQVDARQSLIFIEPKGRALIERTKSWVHEMNNSLLANFNAQERKTIQRFLSETAQLKEPHS